MTKIKAKKTKKVSLPKGDKTDIELVITCERNHKWFVVDNDTENFEINAGCHEFNSWEDAFEHYRPVNWYCGSNWANEHKEELSDEELEQTRKRCVQRLEYLKTNYKRVR